MNEPLNRRLVFQLCIILAISLGIYTWHHLLALIIFLGLSSYALYQYFNKRQKHIQNLLIYLENLNQNHYPIALQEYAEGELSMLYAQLNKTSLTLKTSNESLKKQKEFLIQALEDLSHQLKTPITSLRILNELQAEDTYVAQSRLQIERLERLTQSFLTLTRLDANIYPFNIKEIPLSYFLDKLKAYYPDLSLEIKEMTLYVDEYALFESLLNIVENKTRFMKTQIKLQAFSMGAWAIIDISDDGDAIFPQERNLIFNRFYSGRKKNPQSMGIGLSLAKEFIQGQGGTIQVIQANTFRIRVPKVSEL